jgi:phosphate transport system permease protein
LKGTEEVLLNKTKNKRKGLSPDSIFRLLTSIAALAIIGLVILLAFELYQGSQITIKLFGFGFVIKSTWDPVHVVFGALPFIYGTLLTSLIALLIGLPIGLGVAIFLSEKIRAKLSINQFLGSLIELLAAVPSVIYGLWALFVLSPFLRVYVEAPLHQFLGFIPLFSTAVFGLDFFTAGVILAIMIIPTVSAISRDVLNAVPTSQREAMYSLGATDWEVIRKSILPYAKSGLFGAAILGLGRAVGETMAVTMVIGNEPSLSPSLFHGGYTMAAVIANEFTEATSTTFVSALIEIGLILFFVALIINVFARLLIWRTLKYSGRNI